MNPIRSLRTAFGNLARMVQLLAEIREGVANLTDVVNRKLEPPTGGAAQPANGSSTLETRTPSISNGSASNAGARLRELPASDSLESERSASIRRPPSSLGDTPPR